MLPIYLNLLGTPKLSYLAFVYVLFVSFLLVSTLPVLSGKRIGKRVPPEMVLPIFVVVVLFVALLVTFPWEVLTVGTVLYLAALPLGWFSYRDYQRKDAGGGRARNHLRPHPPKPKRRRSIPICIPAMASAPAA